MSAETENEVRAAYKHYRDACEVFLKRRVHPWLGVLSPRWGKVVSELLSQKKLGEYQRLLQGYEGQTTRFGRWWYGLRHGLKQKSIHLRYQGMQTLSKPFEAGGGLGDSAARAAFSLSLQGWVGWLTPKGPVKGLLHRMTDAFWGWVKGSEQVAEAKAATIASREESSVSTSALAEPRLDEASSSREDASFPSYALVKVAPSHLELDLNALFRLPEKALEAQRIREAFNAIALAFRNWLDEMSHLLGALNSVGEREDYQKTFHEAEHTVKDFKHVMRLVYHPDKVKDVEEREVREICFKALGSLLAEAQRRFAEIKCFDTLTGQFEGITYYRARVEASRACLSTMMLGRETGDIVQSTRVLMASLVKSRLAMKAEVAAFDAQLMRSEKRQESDLAEIRSSLESTEKELEVTEKKLDATEKKLDATEKKLESTEKKLEAVEKEAAESRVSRELTEKKLDAVEKEATESRVSCELTEKKLEVTEKKLDAVEKEAAESRVTLAATIQKVAELSAFMNAFQDMAASQLGFSRLTQARPRLEDNVGSAAAASDDFSDRRPRSMAGGSSSRLGSSRLTETRPRLEDNVGSAAAASDDFSGQSPRSTAAGPSSRSSFMGELTSLLNDSSSCASSCSEGRLVGEESDGFTEENSLDDSRSSSRRSSFFQVSAAGVSESAGIEFSLKL